MVLSFWWRSVGSHVAQQRNAQTKLITLNDHHVFWGCLNKTYATL